MQEKVIKSLSNIESLMINKLANTQQKLNVLKKSDKKDVIDFLDRSANGSETRGRKRSTSKFKRNNKLKNVHSIQAEAHGLRQPYMQFVDRSITNETWARKPDASFMSTSLNASPRGVGGRKKSRSKFGAGGLMYTSMVPRTS